MKNMERNISKLVNRFIKESFVDITDMDTDKAVEEVTEKAHGKDKKFGDGRDRIDVAEPKGKITGADFRKLQSMKKKEMGENYGMEDEMGGGYYKYDNPNRHKAAKLADRFPGVTFSDDDLDRSEDELTADYEKIMGKRKRFDVNDPNFRSPGGFEAGELVFEEGETEEGNEFTGALAKAKEEGKDTFTVDGKEYNVTKESVNKKIERILERRRSKVNERKEKTNQNKVVFSESELIDFIERIVEAEIKTDKDTSNALSKTKKVNSDATKEVVEKMKNYMKNMGMEYTDKPQKFPKGNDKMSREDFGKEVTDDKKKAYKASDAVGEYIEAFAYPGMTNLVFDEIKPVEEKIEKYLKGDSTTGNAQVDEDGNALGNVVPSEVGEKFFKNYKDNLYGAEQMNASYKRVKQPVEVAGEETQDGPLKKSTEKAQKIFNDLQESKQTKKVISDLEKMKKLIDYNQKTQ